MQRCRPTRNMKFLAVAFACFLVVVHLKTADCQNALCASVTAASRVSCASNTIAPDLCKSRGCCYDNKTSVAWCYMAPTAREAACLAHPVSARIDCGGGTQAECRQRGCCYDDSRRPAKWCFNIPSDGDDCKFSPCQNGGTCTDGVYSFTCTCASGYTGTYCQTFDPCSTSPCQNGGQCSVSGSTYTCACAEGYSGTDCDVDPCSTSPCQNGGQCTVSGSTYTCACAEGFTGTDCEVDPCSTSPCQNGGQCTVSGSSYTCACAEGYSGTECDVDPCSASPCQNGGQCSVSGSSYTCACAEGYSGTDCEVTTTTTTTTTTTPTTTTTTVPPTTTTTTPSTTTTPAPVTCSVTARSYSYQTVCSDGTLKAFVEVNGVKAWTDYTCGNRGVNVMMLDPITCAITHTRRFDTWVADTEQLASKNLKSFIDYVADGVYLVGVTVDEPMSNLDSSAQSILVAAGVSIRDVQHRGNFAFFIRKGYPVDTVMAKGITATSISSTINARVTTYL